MADQKINALPVKSAPTSGDKMLMIGAAEEYQIDYDQLATAILNKLTSKTFTLDQGTKSLVAALNELNSNIKGSATNPITLYTSNDLNDILDPGFYFWAGGYGPQNNPYNNSSISGSALVIRTANGYYAQFVFSAHDATWDTSIHSRVYRDSVWGSWRSFSVSE